MSQEIIQFDIDELSFDPHNPRFSSISVDNKSDAETIDLMIREESLMDLVVSITDNGFFQGEPLLVYADGDKKYVAEGNRRLAALKLINNRELTKRASFHQTIAEAKHIPTQVPCLLFENREETLVYLGYKHITGNKKWGALEKSIYLSQLYEHVKEQNPDQDEQELHRIIARNVGSQGPVIGRNLAAYAIYLEGNQHGAANNFFDLQGVDQSQVDFSLIYTALSYENIYKYLGLESATDTSLKNFNKEHGKNLFRWLFKQDDYGQTVVTESRKLKELNKVLGSVSATKYFLEKNDLESAYRLSAGPLEAFEMLLKTLKRDIEQFKILEKDIRLDVLDKKIDSPFTNAHVVEIGDAWRELRTLHEEVESFMRKSEG